MAESGKYRTPQSIEELFEVFRREGMSEAEIAGIQKTMKQNREDNEPEFESPSLDDAIEIYERTCSVCGNDFKQRPP